MANDDDDLLDCFINLPVQQNVPFRMDFQTIAEAQLQDAALLEHNRTDPTKVKRQLKAPDTPVYTCAESIGGSWKIYLPTSLLQDAVKWYHLALGHIGTSRLLDTLKMHFYHPRLQHVCMACAQEVKM